MTEIRFAVAHSEWALDRRDFLKKMRAQFASFGVPLHVSASKEREHACVWATRLWRWAAEQDADVVLLNDDVHLPPAFPDAVKAMLAHAQSEIVSLHCALPAAVSLAHAGQRFVTSWFVTGPGYVLRRGVAKQLLRFVERMNPKHYATINEDNTLIYHAWSRREPVWQCIPALVKHETDVRSTLGYDEHADRVTPVPWDLPMFAEEPPDEPAGCSNEDGSKGRNTMLTWPDFWRQPTPPAFIECPWMPAKSLQANEVMWLLGVEPGNCWSCLERKGEVGAPKTGLMLCSHCAIGMGGAATQTVLAWRSNVLKRAEAERKKAPPVGLARGPARELHDLPPPEIPRDLFLR